MTDDNTTNDGFHLTSRMVLLGLLVAVAVIFVVQNTGSIRANFLFLHLSMPQWLFIIVLIALGMAIDRLVIWIAHRRASKAS